MSPLLAGRFLIPGPPGKSSVVSDLGYCGDEDKTDFKKCVCGRIGHHMLPCSDL